jgi:membrane peptidoglycan carboxypeptidase
VTSLLRCRAARHRAGGQIIELAARRQTGTTDDYSDAWFVGFDPDITIGLWIGFDQKRLIGHNQTGAVAALPIGMEIGSPGSIASAPPARNRLSSNGRQRHHGQHRERPRGLHRRHRAGSRLPALAN